MPALVVIHGPHRGEYHNITLRAALVVGRDESLLAQLTGDSGLSRKHVEFIRHADDGMCFAVDLQSRNGVRVNGTKINHSQEIADGDIIQIGHTLMVYVNKDLDDKSPIKTFLNACEKLYGEHLDNMREHDKKMARLQANANEGTIGFGASYRK